MRDSIDYAHMSRPGTFSITYRTSELSLENRVLASAGLGPLNARYAGLIHRHKARADQRRSQLRQREAEFHRLRPSQSLYRRTAASRFITSTDDTG